MFDIGWSEMAVIALVALIVIGPKELPQAMRAAAKWARKARSLAREFQSGIDDMIREAELEDARKAVETTRNFDLDKALEDTVDPTGSVREEATDIERSARGAEETGGPAPQAETEETAEAATVIEHPARVAPPHSLTPPPEPADEAAPETAGTAPGEDSAHGRA
ncbi:MAG: Sec-independent protein translocase protein TatB [Kiloniellaceae bacterium]